MLLAILVIFLLAAPVYAGPPTFMRKNVPLGLTLPEFRKHEPRCKISEAIEESYNLEGATFPLGDYNPLLCELLPNYRGHFLDEDEMVLNPGSLGSEIQTRRRLYFRLDHKWGAGHIKITALGRDRPGGHQC